jgi:hypothetical protein
MGNIFQGIFGGSKSKQQSTSENVNNQYLKQNLGGYMGAGGGANDMVSKLLMGGAGADEGFQKYKDSAGYGFTMDSGSRAITGNAASRGLLSSGATGKALTTFGQNVGQQYYNNYIDKLMGLSSQGLNAGGIIAGAGQKSQSTGSSSSKEGMSKFLGQLGAGLAMSDPRLKYDVILLGELESGLPYYSFKYIGEDERHVGVMADEVAVIQPDALGPEVDGFMSVDYDKIVGWN